MTPVALMRRPIVGSLTRPGRRPSNRVLGYCPQFDVLFDFMTVEECLRFYGMIKGIDEQKRAYIIVFDDLDTPRCISFRVKLEVV